MIFIAVIWWKWRAEGTKEREERMDGYNVSAHFDVTDGMLKAHKKELTTGCYRKREQ